MKDKKPTSAVWKNCLEEACARNDICLEICSSSHAKSVASLGLKVAAKCCTIKDFRNMLTIRFRIRIRFHLSITKVPCNTLYLIGAHLLTYSMCLFLSSATLVQRSPVLEGLIRWFARIKIYAVNYNIHCVVWKWIMFLKYLCID